MPFPLMFAIGGLLSPLLYLLHSRLCRNFFCLLTPFTTPFADGTTTVRRILNIDEMEYHAVKPIISVNKRKQLASPRISGKGFPGDHCASMLDWAQTLAPSRPRRGSAVRSVRRDAPREHRSP